MRRSIILLLCVLALTIGFSSSAMAQDDGGEVVHVVQPGENLFRISLRYNVSMGAIAQANGIGNINVIYVGQRLTIPGTTGGTPPPADDDGGVDSGQDIPAPSTYTVVAGDTLANIARRFNTTVQALVTANGITNPNLIFVGQQLTIPGGTGTGQPTTPTNPPPSGGNPAAGAFELGGQVAAFSFPDLMTGARMTWVKRQVIFSGQPASEVQGIIDQAHSLGFKILLSIVGDHNALGQNRAGYIQQYANFVAGVSAFGPDGIEVWNEANIDREWPAGQISGAAYTELLRASYQAIKGANQNVMVISGAPAPTGAESAFPGRVVNDDNFIRQMRDAGAANFLDCVGIHYNEGILPPTAVSGDPRGNSSYYTRYYPAMVDLYASVFPGKPLCFTELGYLTGEGYGGLPNDFAWASDVTIANQAEWLAGAVTQARASGRIRLLIVWNVDFTVFGDDPQAGFAIVRADNTCPACNALAQAMQ